MLNQGYGREPVVYVKFVVSIFRYGLCQDQNRVSTGSKIWYPFSVFWMQFSMIGEKVIYNSLMIYEDKQFVPPLDSFLGIYCCSPDAPLKGTIGSSIDKSSVIGICWNFCH